jgi:ClpP class serine protease
MTLSNATTPAAPLTMATRLSARFERRGRVVAIQPDALLEVFELREAINPGWFMAADGAVAVVPVCGPLTAEADGWWLSYADITQRVRAATESGVRFVVLRISSPGGDAYGSMECAREIRAVCAAAGKQLIAYVEERACSAAYAVACGASKIYLAPSSIVGSIGVLAVRDDVTVRNEAMGLRVALITSGARKADGNPDTPITSEELVAQQLLVDGMAALFFELVREARNVDAKALQAAVFLGQDAVTQRLADGVTSFDGLLVLTAKGLTNMTAIEEARQALKKASEGEGPDAEAAKRALAAMDEDKKPEAEDESEDKPAAEDESEDKPAAEHEEPDGDEAPATPPAKDKAKAATATATSAASALKLAQQALREVRSYTATQAKSERVALYATRPDWTPEIRKEMDQIPLATVRTLAAKMAKPAAQTATAAAALAAATAAPTRGNVPASAPMLPPNEANALAMRMGLIGEKTGVIASDYKLQLGVSIPAIPGAPGVEVNRG